MGKGTIRRFEDLEAWKVGRELCREVYAVIKKDDFARDYGLRDQIQRASVSVMTNVAEGFERGSNKDFARMVFVARGSAGEVRSLLYVARDQGYIDDSEFKSLFESAVKCSQLCWGLIRHLKKNSDWVTGFTISIWMLCSVAANGLTMTS